MALYNQGNKVGIGTVDLSEVNEKIDNKADYIELTELKMLGWTTPKDFPIQNEVNGSQFIQRVGRADLGNYRWKLYNVAQGTLFRTAVLDNMKTVDNYETVNAFLDGYSTSPSNTRKEKTISCTINGFDVIDSSYADASTFKTAMQGKYLYYELATPITKQIDGNEFAITKLLWENPNPSSTMAENTQITLSDKDVDFLEILFISEQGTERVFTQKIPYGNDTALCTMSTTAGAYFYMVARNFNYSSSSGNYSVSDGFMQRSNNTAREKDNKYAIPLKVYGIKSL